MCAYFPEFIKTIRILTPCDLTVILSRQEKPVMFSNFVIEKINHASMVSKNRLQEGYKCKLHI